jgi:hypothetical protein
VLITAAVEEPVYHEYRSLYSQYIGRLFTGSVRHALRPLVNELLYLWAKPGVHVWDEHKQEEFDLQALLFVTINDWPALSNILG